MEPLAKLQRDSHTSIKFDGDYPQIIGHRGSGIKSSEDELIIGNTNTAIANGIKAGVDWVEVDIRVSNDGQLVVFHDEEISEKTNGIGTVKSLSIGDLKAVTVNVEPPESISTLDEMFGEFHTKNVKWILDIKVEEIHELVLKWIDNKIAIGELSKDQVIIFGTYDVLTDYKNTGYSLGYTAIWGNYGNRLRVLFQPAQIIKRCQFLECDYLVLPVIFADRTLIDTANSRELEVWVYGVDDERDLNYLVKSGVSGFIVDRPKTFKENVGELRPH